MMMRAVISLAFTGLATPAALYAPDAQAAVARDATCLAGSTQGSAPDRQFSVIVPNNAVAAFEARGLVQTPCNGKEAAVLTFRDKICDFAQRAPQSVQLNFRSVYRFTPEELCNAASNIVVE